MLQLPGNQLAGTENEIDNLLNAIQAGAFNASVKRRLDEMEETKEKLELSIVKEKMKKPQFMNRSSKSRQ